MVSRPNHSGPGNDDPGGEESTRRQFLLWSGFGCPNLLGVPASNPNKFELPVRPPRQFPENHYTRRYNDWIGQKQEPDE